MSSSYRLGIDIGTNSIGWALFALDGKGHPERLVDAGVRIYSSSREPKTEDPLGKARREARQARRQRDRRLQRKGRVMAELVRLGLMPANAAERKELERLDPYELRARALDEALHPHRLGRALFHLAQRRGFKSNRIAEDEREKGKIRHSIDTLREEMERVGARTLGEYWYHRRRRGDRVRGAFWTERAMLEEEFRAIVEAQKRLQPGLAGTLDRALQGESCLFGRIFHQRPLGPQKTGKCTVDGESDRAPWAHPLAQQFRILQELANLRVRVPPDPGFRPLSREEFTFLHRELSKRKELGFDRMRRLLGLPADARFNLESEGRKKLDGDRTAAILGNRKILGKRWHTLSSDEQQRIVERLLAETEEGEIVRFGRSLGLDEAAAKALAAARLPQGHCHLGLAVLKVIIPIMRDRGLGYAEAVKEAGYHHSDLAEKTGRGRLPYYGEVLRRWCLPGQGKTLPDEESEYGRIANPTVHVGLNQLRKLVNAIIETYGRPDEIHVELARELKLGRENRRKVEREQAGNRERNREADEAMRRAGLDPETMGAGSLAENRRRYRLWLELDEAGPQRRCCPYSGRAIGIRALFSSEVEIEHILPFARTLDDSMANKTVAYREANRDKRERTPFEAFGTSPVIDGRRYDWEAIAQRASRMPQNKSWRFASDAMDRFEKTGNFVDRQLTDTTYFARLTRIYLQSLYRREEGDRVVAIPGRLTALLRRKWGLDRLLAEGNWKNREDHRHHAIDAAVVACTDRRTLQAFAREDERGRQRIVIPPPYEQFREELGRRLAGMIVSHKPEHGIAGRLHEETAYGATRLVNEKGTPCYVVRWPTEKFTNERHLDQIRDRHLRRLVKEHVGREIAIGRSFKEALASFRAPNGKAVRRLRVLVPFEEGSLVPIRNGRPEPFKYYPTGANAYLDVLELPDGRWFGWAVSRFEANRLARNPGPPPWKSKHPAARRVMRLYKGDLVAVERDGSREIMKVFQMNQNGRVLFAPHYEGGPLQKRHDDTNDPFRWLMASASTFPKLRLRKVSVDILGRLKDPGFADARKDRGDRQRQPSPVRGQGAPADPRSG
ncbi:MAG TPA: type II CRISPR RNA-guided endonuclease Cas9 [Rhodospirillales bacterium]|nr:type II CRISPR RNA-guided endonuclease Cas9 [Rhodospirillales bacterium]